MTAKPCRFLPWPLRIWAPSRLFAFVGLTLWLMLGAVGAQHRDKEQFKEQVVQSDRADPEMPGQINEVFNVFEDLLVVSQNAAAPNSHWRVQLEVWRETRDRWEKASAKLPVSLQDLTRCSLPITTARRLLEQADELFVQAQDQGDPARAVNLLVEHENLQKQARELLKQAQQGYQSVRTAYLRDSEGMDSASGSQPGSGSPISLLNGGSNENIMSFEQGGSKKGVGSVVEACRLIQQAINLYHTALQSPERTGNAEWHNLKGNLDGVFQAEPEPGFHNKVMKNCHCPVMTAKMRLENLRKSQLKNLNSSARDARSRDHQKVAIEEEKDHIRTEIRRAEECLRIVCPKIPPRCSDSLPEPVVHRLPPVITNLKELAELLFERYDSSHPIAIARVTPVKPSGTRRNTYLIMIAGTEFDYSQKNSPLSWGQEKLNLRSGYRDDVLKALKAGLKGQRIPPGSDFIIVGHSLGGMVALNLAADPLFRMLQPHVVRVITFGTPDTGVKAPNTTYVRVRGYRDLVPTASRVPTGASEVLFVDSDHSGYPDSQKLLNYDAIGFPGKGVMMHLHEFDSYKSSSLLSQTNAVSEEIGEDRMEREAKCLGYIPLLRPSEASSHRQGYDAVYWDPNTCSIVIGEAKGGYNGVKNLDHLLGCAYKCETGHCRPKCQQGTKEWAIAASGRIARSRVTNNNEVRRALQIYNAFKSRAPEVRIEIFHTEVHGGRERAFGRYISYPRDNKTNPSSCK